MKYLAAESPHAAKALAYRIARESGEQTLYPAKVRIDKDTLELPDDVADKLQPRHKLKLAATKALAKTKPVDRVKPIAKPVKPIIKPVKPVKK